METFLNVQEILKEAGFTETGQIANPGVVRYFGGRAVGGKFSYRIKFRKGNIGCTVGKRTTCIYKIGPNGPTEFKNIRTVDVKAVCDAIASIGGAV